MRRVSVFYWNGMRRYRCAARRGGLRVARTATRVQRFIVTACRDSCSGSQRMRLRTSPRSISHAFTCVTHRFEQRRVIADMVGEQQDQLRVG